MTPNTPRSAPQPIDTAAFSPLLSLLLAGRPSSPTNPNPSTAAARNRAEYGNPQGFGVPRSFFTGRGSGASPSKWSSSGPVSRPTKPRPSQTPNASPPPNASPLPNSSPLLNSSPYNTPRTRLA